MSDTPPTSKACTKCGVVKPLGEFFKRSDTKTKYKSHCKQCMKLAIGKWRLENQDHEKERKAKWRLENNETVHLQNKTWYANNKNADRLRTSKWYEKNCEKAREKSRDRVSEISNSYVAGMLKIPVANTPPGLIELKRQAIAMQRISKQIKQITNPKKAAS